MPDWSEVVRSRRGLPRLKRVHDSTEPRNVYSRTSLNALSTLITRAVVRREQLLLGP